MLTTFSFFELDHSNYLESAPSKCQPLTKAKDPTEPKTVHHRNNQVATPICVSVIFSGGTMCESTSSERLEGRKANWSDTKRNICKRRYRCYTDGNTENKM